MRSILFLLVALAWLAVTSAAAGHVLLRKRDPRGSALWLVLIVLLPVAGPAFYWILGVNRLYREKVVQARREAARGSGMHRSRSSAGAGRVQPPAMSAMNRISERITGEPLVEGNLIDPLYEGNQAFPAMLTAIGAAQRSVNLTTYILDRDAVGRRIVHSLCDAARRGVQVRVLVDGVGTSRAALAMAHRLRGSGASLAVFHPLPLFPFRRPSINLRNHRKILIVDGKVGFTGGINLTSRHLSTRMEKEELARDVHFRVEGPVLASMQEVFADDWYASQGEIIEGDLFFPELPRAGECIARAVASGPDQDLEKIYQIVLAVLRSARDRVVIMTPYFIPDRAIIQAVRTAVLAGVAVDLLLPAKSDHPLVQMASMSFLPELIETGVRAIMVPPPFVHSKLMIVDGTWSLIGSANLDPRSFRLSFEFDLEVYSRQLAVELERYAQRMS
ncbi:MAG: cardiolipin synthase, partial [bacterium]